jgi:hypothetical protein
MSLSFHNLILSSSLGITGFEMHGEGTYFKDIIYREVAPFYKILKEKNFFNTCPSFGLAYLVHRAKMFVFSKM